MSTEKTLATVGEQQITLPEETLSKLVLHGDLSGLNDKEKVLYYNAYCQRIGVDPVTKPFAILKLKGKNGEPDKEVLYCPREGVAQLTKIYKVSHKILSREERDGCYVVTAQAVTPDGRSDESIGAVPIEKESGEWKEYEYQGKKNRKFIGNGLYVKMRGEALCNAMMKAETKAKRRATLDLLGLGIIDESEIESIRATQAEDPILAEEAAAITDAVILDYEKERAKKLGINPEMMEPMEVTKPEKKEEAAKVSPAAPVEKPAKVVEVENPEAWRDVVCHIGKAQGAMLGKKVGELHAKLLAWLKNKIEENPGETWSKAEATLHKAVLCALEAGNNKTAEPGKKEPADELDLAAPVPEKYAINVESKVEKIEPVNWKNEVIEIKVKDVKGKQFGELDDRYLRALKSLVDVPEKAEKAGVTPRFKVVLQMALDERGLFKTPAELIDMISGPMGDLVLTEPAIMEYLKELEITDTEKTFVEISPELLLYIWQNIGSICEEIKKLASPNKGDAKTGKGKKK